MSRNELFGLLRSTLFHHKIFFSKVICCCFEEVTDIYKVTGKAAGGKEQFDDGYWNGVCERTNSINKRIGMNPKGENKLHPIIEKYINIDAKIQEPRYGMNEIHEGPHIKHSNSLHEMAVLHWELTQDTVFFRNCYRSSSWFSVSVPTPTLSFLLCYYFTFFYLCTLKLPLWEDSDW